MHSIPSGGATARGGCALPHWLAADGGMWVLKGSESNRGEDLLFLDGACPADRAAAESAMAAAGGAAW